MKSVMPMCPQQLAQTNILAVVNVAEGLFNPVFFGLFFMDNEGASYDLHL
jgi:hypothetical protein